MLAGTLEISIMADMSRLAQDFQTAKRLTGDSMSSMATSMAQVQKSIDAMADVEKARASVFSRTLDETNRLLEIAKGAADNTAKSLASLKIDPNALKIPDNAIQALKTWQEKSAYAIGAGAAAGWDKAKIAWEDFKGWIESKIIIFGVALAVGISAAVLSAVYAAYKAVSFGVGLLTGESYKSENIDALVKMNDEVKTLQENLPLTAVGASALNEALKQQGISASGYIETIGKVNAASRTNGEELDRLGVKYKDQKGNLLDTKTIMASAAAVLATYASGWDREQAAASIAIGSEKQIQDALSITADKTQTAKDRLAEYGLVIGDGTQEAVTQYEEAMLAFNREADLTSQGFKRAIADNVMPILTMLAEFFRDGFPTVVRAFRYTIAEVMSLFYGLKTVVYMVAESIVGSISAIGSVLGGMATAAGLALTGDFSGAKDALVNGWVDAKARLGLIGDNIVEQARRNAAAMRLAWGADSLGANGQPNGTTPSGKPWVPKPPPEKEVVDGYAKLQDAAAKYLAALEKEAAQLGMTNVEKKLYDANVVALTLHKGAERDAFTASTTAVIKEVDAYKKAVESAKERADLRKKESDGIEAYMLAEKLSLLDTAHNAEDAVKQAQLEYDTIGMLKSGVQALTLVRLQDKLAIESAGSEAYDSLMRQIEAQKQLIGITKNIEVKTAENSYAQTLHDDVKNALSTAFRDTKDPIAAFGNAVGNVLFTRVTSALADSLATSFLKSSMGTALTSMFSFAGGGYTGDGSRSGGVDGMGGFMAVMHPQETVIDHTRGQSAGGGSNVTNININATVGDIASKSDVVAGMRATANQITSSLARNQQYGGAA